MNKKQALAVDLLMWFTFFVLLFQEKFFVAGMFLISGTVFEVVVYPLVLKWYYNYKYQITSNYCSQEFEE